MAVIFVALGATGRKRGVGATEKQLRDETKKERRVALNKPKSITNVEAGELIHWLDHRFKIIFDLAVQSGLRISDILQLRVKDLHNPMTVYEKKSKRKRTFPITEKLFAQLTFLTDFKRDDDLLFESHHKHAVGLHRSTVHRHIKKAAKYSRTDCSTHSARKLYAKNVLERTGNVEDVQKALNHQKLSTTMLYLDIPQHNDAEIEIHATIRPKTSIFKRISEFFTKKFKKGAN